ncbi:undecaprenyl-diphosphatase UppP [Thermosulfuriphilus sp.]
MTHFEAIFLGIVQGITEFLPISSSGHLALAEYFFQIEGGGLTFDVFLHLGTLVAILIYFWREWLAMLNPQDRSQKRLLLFIVLATIPGALAGALLGDVVEDSLRRPQVIAFSLSSVALLLILAERLSNHHRGFEEIGLREALIIGLAQALAIVPGVSRSGITMTAALFLGFARPAAAKFSFLLSAPIIGGAGLYESLGLIHEGGLESFDLSFLWGFLAAFFSGLLVIAWLLRFLVRHTFYPFAFYRLALAALVMILLIFSPVEARGGQGGFYVVHLSTSPLRPEALLAPIPPMSEGSGIIWDRRGHIVTSYHLIQESRFLEVTLPDGSKWPARVIGYDPETDVALLGINAPAERLSPAISSPKVPRRGEWIFYWGNPWGRGLAVGGAQVRDLRREIVWEDISLKGVIELSTPVPPGFCGGAVVDRKGRLLGMATCLFPEAQRAGIGLAVDVREIRTVFPELLEKGYIERAWFGVVAQDLVPAFARAQGLPVEKGAVVFKVLPDSPAARAGLKGGKEEVLFGNTIVSVGGDIIYALDGQPVASAAELERIISKKKPGQVVKVAFFRGKKKKEVRVRLMAKPGYHRRKR